jgi:hypothetical protein
MGRWDVSASAGEVSRSCANGQRASGDGGPTGVKTGVAIAVGASAILHVCVLWVLDLVEPPKEKERELVRVTLLEPRERGVAVADAAAADIAPMEVEMVEVPAAPTAQTETQSQRQTETQAQRSSRSTSTSTPTSARVASETESGSESGSESGPESGSESESGPGPGMGKLSMRRPDLGVAGVVLHEDPEAHRAEDPLTPTGKLRPDGGGTYRTQRPGFAGKVGRDGKVSFKDKPAFSVGWRLPNPVKLAKAAAKGLEEYYRDPYAQVKEAERDWTSGLEVKDYTKHLDKREDEDDKADHGGVATIPILGGSTEITDYVMRKLGEDPYQSDKLLWMDQTRDERVQIGRVHRERQLKRADEIMRRHLDRVWARTDLRLAEKKEALFELWDDGAEDGDAMLIEAAGRARTLVIGFVRSRLPAGSPGAYTRAELEALNRRRTSRARFAPYE